MDEPTCPKCGHYNAMIVRGWTEKGEAIRTCRDCGHTPEGEQTWVDASGNTLRLANRSSWQRGTDALKARMLVVEVHRGTEWLDFATLREDELHLVPVAVLNVHGITPEPARAVHPVSQIEALKRDCLNVQDACNLSGVLHSWAKHQATIREHAKQMGVPYERHPANVLFMSKVASLMQVNADCIGGIDRKEKAESGRWEARDLFTSAYRWAKGELPPTPGEDR